MRRSPRGSCLRNSSISRRELPPLSDMVTIAVSFMGIFFRCESSVNVPEPPPIVTTRRPAKRSSDEEYAATLILSFQGGECWSLKRLRRRVHERPALSKEKRSLLEHVCVS